MPGAEDDLQTNISAALLVPVEGESYRLKEAMARAEQKAAARAAAPRKGKKA